MDAMDTKEEKVAHPNELENMRCFQIPTTRGRKGRGFCLPGYFGKAGDTFVWEGQVLGHLLGKGQW